MLKRFLSYLLKPGLVLAVYVIATLTISYLKFSRSYPGDHYTKYNNYIIFSRSFTHLIQHKDLYDVHPDDHFDYYKYSPAFAFFMAPFNLLPDFPGLALWNLLNALVLFYAIFKMKLPDRDKMIILWLILPELIKSTENSQSNGLIAGLIVAAFSLLGKKNMWTAALLITFSGFIKIFGLAAGILFLIHPEKIKSISAYAASFVLLLLIPLCVIDFQQLIFLYKSWGHLLANDYTASSGISVMGLLQSWFHFQPDKIIPVLTGAVILFLPLSRKNKYASPVFRMKMLASVLIWMIIFNHKTESPTLVIAITGIAIWYFTETRHWLNNLLLILSILFTILPSTDIYPATIRENIIAPYAIQVVPCMLIWLKISFELLFRKDDEPVSSHAMAQ
ncbi:MAG: glycosyltransferase family 87 protein [Bacteroidetes bacterium]|nr:glycosyltransferase family 87 protein [Bacteroidota bacterium]